MNDQAILKKLQQIATMIDKNVYPQTVLAIKGCADKEFQRLFTKGYVLALTLTSADETEQMHPLVASLVKHLYKKEIADGNSDAACNLGSLYYTGRIGKQSYRKAVKYYTKAADAGNIIATENLGYCYYYGRDMAKDYEKAFKCFAFGAFNGRLISLYKIGDMYKNGYYVNKNEKTAFEIYSRCLRALEDNILNYSAAIRCDLTECGADIYMRVADCYYQGIGATIDYERALRYFQRAEGLFRVKLKNGDFLIKKCYAHCVEVQAEIRQLLEADLPKY